MVKLGPPPLKNPTIFTLDFLTQLMSLNKTTVAAYSWLQGEESHIVIDNIVFGASKNV